MNNILQAYIFSRYSTGMKTPRLKMRHGDGRPPPGAGKEKGPQPREEAGGPGRKAGGALLSHAPGRSTIAAGALNVRVREGNGCDSPAKATGHKINNRKRKEMKGRPQKGRRGAPGRRVARDACFSFFAPGRPAFAGRRGAERASRTAYQNRSAETLAGLAHPACRPGRLPGAFSVLAHGDG